MRVASLLPSATETVCAIGGRNLLVGVSHECDYPEGVERRAASVLRVTPEMAFEPLRSGRAP